MLEVSIFFHITKPIKIYHCNRLLIYCMKMIKEQKEHLENTIRYKFCTFLNECHIKLCEICGNDLKQI